jgi:hypothetical protein
MALVDDRGRIGGTVNVIDAAIAVVLIGLIPFAFGAYLLFRTPMPTLVSVVPESVYPGSNVRVTIRGENLRPFLRVTFNGVQANSFLIGNTNNAMVELPDLAPGTYDVVLWDYKQEIGRLPEALRVLPLTPTPTIEMQVKGTFKDLPPQRMNTVKPGDQFPPTGTAAATVVSVEAPKASEIQLRAGTKTLTIPVSGKADLPAILQVKCFTVSNADGSVRCAMAGPVQQVDVAPGSFLSLAGPDGWIAFQISEVLPPPAQR